MGGVKMVAALKGAVTPGFRHLLSVAILQYMLLLCVGNAGCLFGVAQARAQETKGVSPFDTHVIRSPSGDAATVSPGRAGAGKRNEAPDRWDTQLSSKRAKNPQGKPKTSAVDAVPGATNAAVTEGATGTSEAGGSSSAEGKGSRSAATSIKVSRAAVTVKGAKTRFTMSLTKGVRAEIFTLASPYRIIIDLPDVAFNLPDGTGQNGQGLVSAFRYGLFAEHKGRVVLDTTDPVRIEGAKMVSAGREHEVNLELEIVAISAAEFGNGTGAGTGAGAPPIARPAVFDDSQPASKTGDKPLVLIDPGHGGIDPGAVGVGNILEKNIVFAVGKKLAKQLEASGRYRVALTRKRDVFITLDQRVALSQEIKADLFISLHADAIASKTYAPVVRGATVYTLSERATDERARLIAEKENASDLVAGIDSAILDRETGAVRSILFDLMKRETSNFSTRFSNILVSRLKGSISLSRDPQRSAAFRVLKQAHTPSVLVELGYMSNEADAKLMSKAQWQSKVAKSIVAAVDVFFDQRTARTAP